MRKSLVAFWILTVSPCCAQVLAVDAPPPGRDFGYFAGDRLSRRVVIDVAQGTALDRRTLPSAGPVGASLDIYDVSVSDRSDSHGRSFIVDITYQTFLAPEQATRAEAPRFALGFIGGGRRFIANVPGFDFAVSPFRHDLQPVVDVRVLRPDHAPPKLDRSQPDRAFAASAAVGLACAGLLAVDRYRHRFSARQSPFAQAAREVALRHGGSPKSMAEPAIRALHRAFDDTAGRRVMAADLDSFLAQHAAFVMLRAEIDKFFLVSHSLFFTRQATPHFDLRQFAQAMARAERGA